MLDHEKIIVGYAQVTDRLSAYIDSLDDVCRGIATKERSQAHMIKHLSTGFTAEKAIIGSLLHYGVLSQIQGFEGRAADAMNQVVGMAQIFGEDVLKQAQQKATALAFDLKELGQFPESILQHIDRQLENPKDYAQFEAQIEA